jgi:signal peptidase I
MEPTLLGHKYPTPVHDHILVNKAVYRLRDPQQGEIIVFAAPPEAIRMSSLNGQIAEGKQTDYIKRAIGVEGDVIHVEPGYLMVDGRRIDRAEFQSWVADAEGVIRDNIRIKFTSKAVYLDNKKLSDEDLIAYLSPIGVDPESHPKIEIHPGFVVRNGQRLNEPFTAEDPEIAYPDPSDDHTWPSVQKAVEEKRLELVQQDGRLAVKIGNGELFAMGDNRNHSLDSRFWGPLDRDRVLGRSMFIFFPFNRMHWSR